MLARSNLLGCLVALALAPAVRAEDSQGADDLVQVWGCRFDNDAGAGPEWGGEWDVNYDDWPDRWTRAYDDEHPQYVRMLIEPNQGTDLPGKRLVIYPDGASATVTSPALSILPKFSWKLRMLVRVRNAKHGVARARLAFHHRQESQPRQVEQTPPLPADGEWHEVELGDYKPRDSDVDRAYLDVDFERGERADLDAEVSIANIRLYRLPSIRIHTDSAYNVYTNPEEVCVTCSLSGILEQDPEIRFELLDATDKSISEKGQLDFEGRVIDESRIHASDIVDGFGSDKTSYEGETTWWPPIKDYGFYRVRVGMYNRETREPIGDRRAITVAVVPDSLVKSDQGEFGWSLPAADRPLSFDVLRELLPRAGVRLAKLPVWYQPGDEQRGDQIIRFAEQLSARGIDTIGVLEDPTPRIADPLYDGASPEVQSFLSTDPSYWTAAIDHVITRLSLRIRWWQLGFDGDTSFVGLNDLVNRLSGIRNQMFRFGQDIRLGIGWRWDYLDDAPPRRAWDFEQMAGRERLDAEGLRQALSSAAPSTAQRWVTVAPPEVDLSVPEGADPKDPDDPIMRDALVHRHQQRVRDFVEQILAAKIHGADAIFVADPFSGSAEAAGGRTGVMNDDGTPGELLLPWRTCARLLGGAKFLGNLQLPAGSSNWLFKRPDGQVVMVLWNLDAETHEANAAPIAETLYLGERVRVVDIWGGTSEPEMQGHRQVVRIGRMPRFVIGLNEGVARWRMATTIESPAVPSVFNERHANALLLKNEFGQGVGGRIEVVVPEGRLREDPLADVSTPSWEVSLDERRIKLKSGEAFRAPMDVVLLNADYGGQLVRLDFEINADRDYRFSVWRRMRVGLDDVQLDVDVFAGEDGRVIVEQRMKQTSGEPTDYRCLLYANGRRRKRALVYQLGQDGDRRTYNYLNPDGLAGTEMTLRVEELDGQRVLIHRFKVEPKPYRPPEESTEDASRGSAA